MRSANIHIKLHNLPEPETRAVHDNIIRELSRGVITYYSASQPCLHPWGYILGAIINPAEHDQILTGTPYAKVHSRSPPSRLSFLQVLTTRLPPMEIIPRHMELIKGSSS
jgi:hypothetical protein